MFDWDDANVDHIARHGITTDEAEEALLDRHRVGVPAFRVASERRRAILGTTVAGRYLVVVYTIRHGQVRVVTERDATRGASLIPKRTRRPEKRRSAAPLLMPTR